MFEMLSSLGRGVWCRTSISSARPIRRRYRRTQHGFHSVSAALDPSQLVSQQGTSSAISENYDAQQIQVLEGLAPVRKRPGMYIGSTSQKGLHHLVYEVLDNAIDEVQAGHANTVNLDINLESGSVSVEDNGRGIPTDLHPQTKKSALETVLTVLHAGGKFGGKESGYTVSGGLHGVGLSVVNALSEHLEVTVWRNARRFKQTFSKGEPISPMMAAKQKPPIKSATKVLSAPDIRTYKIDGSCSSAFDVHVLTNRLREIAFLNNAVTIHYRFQGGTESGEWNAFHFDGGLKAYVEWLTRDKTALHDPIYFMKAIKDVQVEVATQWCSDAFSDSLVGFVNTVKTIDGGTHMDGFRTAVTRSLNNLARKMNHLKENEPNLVGDHLREGLTAVISVKLLNPEFEGQTKTRLGNPEVKKIVDKIVSEELSTQLEFVPDTLRLVIGKALEARRAAEAAKKARDLVRRKISLLKSTLPGKLADCTRQSSHESELFIVEGDSAGGSTKQGRDRRFQAVLPLRGKILNTERNDEASIYKNKELTSLIVALGLEQKAEDIEGLRYDKVIILTDADIDGAHIRTLLLTFLFRYRKALFEQGRVFAAVPPLYKAKIGRRIEYCYSDEELSGIMKKRKSGGSSTSIQRFKGLGEMMPEELWQTTLNPEKRVLRRLTVDDFSEADHIFNVLMGENVQLRRRLIEEEGHKLSISDLDI